MKNITQLLKNKVKSFGQLPKPAIFVLVFATIGIIALLVTRAAAPFASIQPESGAKIGNYSLGSDGNSSGQYVQFGTSSPAEPSSGVCTGRVNGGVPADKFPGAACTGWQGTGVTLTTMTPNWDILGDGSRMGYRISEDNATIEGKDFPDYICVVASNVTIKKSRIRGGINLVKNYGGCWDAEKVAINLRLEDVEVDGGRNYSYAALESNINCLRCNIHSSGQGQQGENFTMIDSYVHDLFGKTETARPCVEFQPEGDVCWSHNEAVLGCCRNITIRHSNLEGIYHAESQGGGMSAALALYSWSSMDNVLIEKTRLKTGALYCAYGGDTHDRPPTTNVRFIDNVFVKYPENTCGINGPMGSWARGGGNQWQNNRYDDGEMIPEPGG